MNKGCQYESRHTDLFTILSLPLSNSIQCTLSECLNLFCEEESLSAAEVALCDNCQHRTAAKKELKVLTWPNLLVVHLIRFEKIISESSGELLGHERSNTAISFPLSNFEVAAFPSVIYDCVGVVNHMGTCGGGHYTAHAAREDNWFYFNDANTPVRIESPEGSLNTSNQNAYMLFFVRQVTVNANAAIVVDM